MIDLSVIIPLFNEEEVLPELKRRLISMLDKKSGNAEIIFIDDGSTHSSRSLIKEYAETDSRIKYIFFSRNFGHQAAVTSGLISAKGRMVAVIDSDLQDPPELIIEMVKEMEKGADVVYAVRQKRKEGWAKRISYFFFYRLARLLQGNSKIPADAGDFALMSRKAVDSLNQLPEKNRFIRGLRSWVGFKQVPFLYERNSRYKGKSKYSLKKLFKLAYDGIFSFSYLPLTFITFVGAVVSLLSFTGILIVLYFRLFTEASIPGFASLSIIILFLGGIQLLSLGIMGEYLKRIYDEAKGRPQYIIETSNI